MQRSTERNVIDRERAVAHERGVAIGEFGWAAAPLVLFALLWLLADSPKRPKRSGAPA
jgi:hypothetical protein